MNLKGIMKTLGAQMGEVVSNPYVRAFAPQVETIVKEEEDHEVSMAQNSLDTIIKMATELKAKMGENEKDIPAWIQDHITNAENFISQASSNYHEYGNANESINEEEIKWNAVENAIINFLKMNTKILDKRVKDRDTEGVKGGLKSIISGLTNAQRSLKLESLNEEFKHIISVETPTQVVSKPIAAQIEKLARQGVRSNEIGLKMGFVGNQKAATDAFQKLKNKIYFSLNKNESVNELKKGSVVIPYAMDKYGEFIVDKVFKNKDGETSYTGKFKKNGEHREFILHSKDRIVKESVNEGLSKDAIVRTLTSDKNAYFLTKDGNGWILDITPKGAQNSTFHQKFTVKDMGKGHLGMKYKLSESVNEAVDFRDGKYRFYSKDGVGYLTYDGKELSSGDFDWEDGSNSYWMSHSSWKGQKSFDTGKDVINYFKSKKITTESVNEARLTDIVNSIVETPVIGKMVRTEAKKYDIGSGWMGNGLTIWNRAEEEHGDYKIIAHISPDGKLSVRDKQLPSDIKKMFQMWADTMKKGDRPGIY